MNKTLSVSPKLNSFEELPEDDQGTERKTATLSVITPEGSHSQGTHTTQRDQEISNLTREVTRLLKERYRLARLHRKAETKVAQTLHRKKKQLGNLKEQTEVLDESRDSEIPEEAERSQGWEAKARTAKESLQDADQAVAAQELHFRLLEEELSSKSKEAAEELIYLYDNLVRIQKNIFRRCCNIFEPNQRETCYQALHSSIESEKGVAGDLTEARKMYFRHLYRKVDLEKKSNVKQEKMKESMLSLIVNTDAFAEEIINQEGKALKMQSQTGLLQQIYSRKLRRKSVLEEKLRQNQEEATCLQEAERKLLHEMTVVASRQRLTRRMSSKVLPSSRLTLDPVIARDVRDKLYLKDLLQDHLSNTKEGDS